MRETTSLKATLEPILIRARRIQKIVVVRTEVTGILVFSLTWQAINFRYGNWAEGGDMILY